LVIRSENLALHPDKNPILISTLWYKKVVENFPNNGIKDAIILIFGVNAIVLTIFFKSRKGQF